VPGFSTLVEGPVPVDRFLGDGDRIGIGGSRHLTVIHTPGHSPGSLSLWLADEGVLIAGDAIPVRGEIPVYDDPVASIRSIARLERLQGVRVLASSWDSPRAGASAGQALADGAGVIRTLHGAVARVAGTEKDPARVTLRVAETLGLSRAALPVITRTVAGHLGALERRESL